MLYNQYKYHLFLLLKHNTILLSFHYLLVYYIHIINTPLKNITFIYKKITPPNHIDPFDSIPKLQIVSDKLEGNSKSGV